MDALQIALSGMQAAQTQLNVAASNVANAQTPDYRPARADLVELSTGGVAVGGISRDPSTGQPQGQQGSNVDLATEMVHVTRAQLLYSANAALVKIGGKTTGSLLDILDNQNMRRDHE